MTQKKKKVQVGIIGSAGEIEYSRGWNLKQEALSQAEELGRLLAKEKMIIVTGGKGGIMEAAAKGAQQAGGINIGVVKGKRRGTTNEYTEIEIISGAEADGLDEYLLVLMCDYLVVFGGGAGTLQELAIAYRNNKKVIIISDSGGWASKLSSDYLDERKRVKFYSAKTAQEALDKIMKMEAKNEKNKSKKR